MKIGVPSEIKEQESRVGLTPASVQELINHDHDLSHQSFLSLEYIKLFVQLVIYINFIFIMINKIYFIRFIVVLIRKF